ncbi:MAG TPA: hypothetical protein VGR78_12790, partial [Verrucomicrobiae bacterium]|nr:hypothetical protein [Verrucomicrobiae bacterium]
VHFDPYRGVEKASELAFEEIIPDEDNRIQIEVSPANPGGNVLLSGLEVEMIPRWLMPPPTILFGSITAFGPPQGDMFLAYGNGRFVAGGGGGPYYSDDNGNAWISPHNALGGQSMIYANGIFVGTTGGGVISSRDGRYWTKHQPTNGFWIPNGVSYGNGVFVATTDTNPSSFYNNSLGVSSDGENWNYYPATNMNLAKTVFGNGRFISISSLTNGLFSEDGIHWSGFFTGIELPARYRGGIRPAGLMFGNGSFFMESSLSASNQVRTFVSADGLAWVPLEAMLPLHNASSYQYDYFLTGTFFSLGAGVMSRDLTNWQNVPVLEGPNIGTSIAYGNSVYLLTGGTGPIGYPHTNVFVARGSSIDALEKIDATFFTASYKSVAVRGNTVAALDSSDDLKSSIYVSTNMGDSFEIVSGPPGVSALISVASGDDRFIAVGERGTLIQSMNGMDWTTLNSSVAADFTGVVFAGQRWFVLGKDGTMLTSPDGQKFSNVPTGATNTLRGLAYGQGAFVSAGDNGTILVSSDGLNWSANKSGTNDLSAVAFGNGLFLVTAGDRLLASADGLSWRDLNYLPITGLVGMAWADGVFCTLSGNNACVSTNGVVWAERPTFGSPTGVVSTGGKTWIYGSNALLSRLILQSPARPSLNAVSNPDGTFTLRIDVPGRADYSILAALSLDANTDWQKLATLTNIASATKWTDYSRARGVRFFQVRQE